jgi:hypothetical protein
MRMSHPNRFEFHPTHYPAIGRPTYATSMCMWCMWFEDLARLPRNGQLCTLEELMVSSVQSCISQGAPSTPEWRMTCWSGSGLSRWTRRLYYASTLHERTLLSSSLGTAFRYCPHDIAGP